jgi:hypothetical protein
MEVNSFFSELLPRLKSIELADDPQFAATTFVRGLKHLPVRYSFTWPTSSSSGEFIRHQLAAAVLPVSAANRFPDLRTVMTDLPMTWTLSIASVVPQYLSRAVTALADTPIGRIGRQ